MVTILASLQHNILLFLFTDSDIEDSIEESREDQITEMATGLPLPLYTQSATGLDLRYKVPIVNDTIFPYVTSGSQLATCGMNMNALTLSQWNYYNSLFASATSQNIMAQMMRMTSNHTRLSPQSRDSGISSDPAMSPQGSLDLSMTPNRYKGTWQYSIPNSCLVTVMPTKSNSDVVFCLQILSKTLT